MLLKNALFRERELANSILNDDVLANYAAVVVTGLKDDRNFLDMRSLVVNNYNENIAKQLDSIENTSSHDRRDHYHRIFQNLKTQYSRVPQSVTGL